VLLSGSDVLAFLSDFDCDLRYSFTFVCPLTNCQ